VFLAFTLQETVGEVTRAYRGATIRFANYTAKTNTAGTATILVALDNSNRTQYRATATVAGHRVATSAVRTATPTQ
jgi:hypothetical protein